MCMYVCECVDIYAYIHMYICIKRFTASVWSVAYIVLIVPLYRIDCIRQLQKQIVNDIELEIYI